MTSQEVIAFVQEHGFIPLTDEELRRLCIPTPELRKLVYKTYEHNLDKTILIKQTIIQFWRRIVYIIKF